MLMKLDLQDPTLLQTQALIDGEWVEATSGQEIDVIDPGTGDCVARVTQSGAAETQRAIDAAERAFVSWRSVPAKQRAALLRKWFELMMEAQEDLAQILTVEMGKVLPEARGEIAYGASFIEWFAEESKRIYGDVIPAPSSDKRIVVVRQPVGVVACITPWNFPNAMLCRKIAPALAAGCTVVCKPATSTPLSALAIGELARRAGIPKGVINIVVGASGEIGPVLTDSPVVRKLTFTGSTPVGKKLVEACAKTLKKVSMELGGNAPFIVFDDADLDAAVAGAMASKYRNAGQTCVCTNRFLVQAGIYERFKEKLIAATQDLKLGHGLEEGVTTGPLVDRGALEEVDQLVQSSIAMGAKVATGGQPSPQGDCFYEPTVLLDVTNDMPIAKEEIFGPVSPLIRFETEEEAIALANDTEVGLAAYFYSRDLGRSWRVSEALEYGMVGINEGIISNEAAPFGGVKESGFGREGSKYGIDDYVEIKYLCMGGLEN